MSNLCAEYKCDHTESAECAYVCECGGTAVEANGKCEGC